MASVTRDRELPAVVLLLDRTLDAIIFRAAELSMNRIVIAEEGVVARDAWSRAEYHVKLTVESID